MKRTYVILSTGRPGSGKTVLTVSYKPKDEEPIRLMIDKKARATEYNSGFVGLEGDHPESLLFDFDFWPDEFGEFSLEQYCQFITEIRNKATFPNGKKYNTILIENMSEFQNDVSGWCQSAKGSKTILKALGIESQFETFLKYRFKPGSIWSRGLWAQH